ncbi:MAG: DUF4145 domain-containing protein, partial [Tissierellia bacterium]|nr:DUF4145 domain-containing protein [Tissierellia bacterium]
IYPFGNTNFSDIVESISPDFTNIYNEAHQAEQAGLTSICGVGYRKAVEFLVKDYAIYLNPEEENNIKKANYTLASCIKDHIDDHRIQNAATASTWLGNDETHYTKRHPDYNYKQMKSFIDTLIKFIELNESYKETESFLGDKAFTADTD